jgi:aerobic-type carbon monoxide dehydrogenase small subunit (CoxS/CutS family)
MEKRKVSLQVNGRRYEREVEPRLTLVDLLRHELDLTGTHVGCEHGVCGACTVLIDGRSARSCLTFAVQVEGCEITTVESLSAPDGEMNALQHAMREQHGLQCGFCTPGVLMSLTELLRDNPDPSEVDVRDVLSGNLCRCTGYSGIVAAALDAARKLRAEHGV